MKDLKTWEIVCLAAAFFLLFSGGKGCNLDLPWTTTPADSLIVMLYESEHGPLPAYALGAANELRDAGREVRMTDDDVPTGTGEVPEWLKSALEPGRAIMGSSQQDDALVILSGQRVVKAIKLPASREAIVEACK